MSPVRAIRSGWPVEPVASDIDEAADCWQAAWPATSGLSIGHAM